MSDVISFADFLKQSNYIFTGFESTVGIESNGKYRLHKGRTLSRYISNNKSGQNQKLRDDVCDCFLNKIRYCLYPEKRIQSEDINVESIDVFSDKCITLIFQLTGINFAFLRMDNENKKFIAVQKATIENLFEIIVSLFKSAEANSLYFNTEGKINNTEIKRCVMLKKELREEIKLYYMFTRFELLCKEPEYLVTNYPLFTNEEYVKFAEYSSYSYEQLNHLITGKRYDLRKDEAFEKLKNGFQHSSKALKKIVNGILKIYSAEKIEDIKGILYHRLDERFYYTIGYKQVIKTKKIILFKNPPEEWKNVCIQLWLKSFSSFITVPKEDDIFIVKQFVSCALFSEKTHQNALDLAAEQCNKMWKCLDFKKSRNHYADERFYEFIEELNTVYFFLITKTYSGKNHLLGLKDEWYEKNVEDYDENDNEQE
jgi:hypothetical protein